MVLFRSIPNHWSNQEKHVNIFVVLTVPRRPAADVPDRFLDLSGEGRASGDVKGGDRGRPTLRLYIPACERSAPWVISW